MSGSGSPLGGLLCNGGAKTVKGSVRRSRIIGFHLLNDQKFLM
jgi:hypothetical protein